MFEMNLKMAFVLMIVALLSTTAHAAPVPSCTMNQISLGLDGENGSFDGMSHSGTLLVLRNLGPTPCSLPGFPVLNVS